MRGFRVKSYLISIACVLACVTVSGCGPAPKQRATGTKTWALLADQPSRLLTQNVNLGLAAAPRQGWVPSSPKNAGVDPVSVRPAPQLVPPASRGGDSEITAASAGSGDSSPNFQVPTRFLADRPSTGTPNLEAAASIPSQIPGPVAVAPAPVSVANLASGGVIPRPSASSPASTSSFGGSGLGSSTSAAASAPISNPSSGRSSAPVFATAAAPSISSAPPSGLGAGTGGAVASSPQAATASSGSASGSGPAEGQTGQGEQVAKTKGPNEAPPDGAPPPNSDATVPADGEIVTSTQAIVLASNSGVVSSQPEMYNMENEFLIPEMVHKFGDDNENLQEWIYTKDKGQENFPTAATIKEGFFSQYEGLLCAPDPKGCEGRILRWFDLGTVPLGGKDPRNYLAALRLSKLKRSQINTNVSYVDVGIGTGNQISMGPLAAKGGHVYFVVLAPEGTAASIAPMEMNLDDPTQYELFLSFVTGKGYRFVRGILVRDKEWMIYQLDPNSSFIRSAPTFQGGTK